jgi:hypothetical protein
MRPPRAQWPGRPRLLFGGLRYGAIPSVYTGVDREP